MTPFLASQDQLKGEVRLPSVGQSVNEVGGTGSNVTKQSRSTGVADERRSKIGKRSGGIGGLSPALCGH